MSGVEIAIAVVAAVAALVSALNDGTELTDKCRDTWKRVKDNKLRKKREQQDSKVLLLKSSLDLGKSTISMEYNKNYQQFGQIFAQGDFLAYTQLQTLKIQILEQIIVNLRSDNLDLNYAILQQCADTSKTQAIDCLGTLRQRLLQAAPIQALPFYVNTGFITETGTILPESSSRGSVDTLGSRPSQRRQSNASSVAASPSLYESTDIYQNHWEDEVAGPSRTRTQRSSFGSSFTSAIGRRTSTTTTGSRPIDIAGNGGERSSPPRQPASPSTSRTSPLAPSVYRTTSSTSTTMPLSPSCTPRSPPVSPPIQRSSFSNPFRRKNSQIPNQGTQPPSSTSRSSIENTGLTSSPQLSSRSPQISPQPFSSTGQPAILGFHASLQQRSIAEEALPSESNKYLGLCKSAWRMQTGQIEKAVDVGTRTLSAFTSQKYIVCTKSGCYFEGALEGSRPERTAVSRKIVRGVYNRIYFRWSFMFICHLPSKGLHDKKFGCIFCCHSAGGNKLPVLFGEQQYLGHIYDVHMGQGRWPDKNVMDRVGAIISKTWPEQDQWDLLLLDLPADSTAESEAGKQSLDSFSRQASTTSGPDAGQVDLTAPAPPELDREETDRFELDDTAVLTPTSSSSSIPPVLPSIGYGNKPTANSSSGASLIEEVAEGEDEDSEWPLQYKFSEENGMTKGNSSATIQRAPSSAFDSGYHAWIAGAIAGPSTAVNATASITQGMAHMAMEPGDFHDDKEPLVEPVTRRTTAYLSLQ